MYKVLQRLDTNILTYIACQNMWYNIMILKDNMSKKFNYWALGELKTDLCFKRALTNTPEQQLSCSF